MGKLSDIGTIKEILSRYGFSFSKSLGQNFLVNPSVCPKMAELGGAKKGVGVIEIGPGIGVLTYELALRADKVVSIELDKRLLPVLDDTLAEFDNVKIINADVLKTDLRRLIEEEFPGMDVVVCANLPYYITSPVIMKLLEERLPIKSITVMVQKEAAQRLCAPLGTREAGAVTAAVNYYANAELLFSVSPGSFMPPPKVSSAVIRLDIRETPQISVDNEKMLFRVIKAAFAQRRKTLLNTLSNSLGIGKEQISRALDASGVSTVARAEQLTAEEFARIANELNKTQN
ncbi:MAG: 16S rRNA (adenine(1518)-N(6)/adenine(1519)-N(6))-dimethyltransferase RsmA [Clostridia bacterium]|nr:16S rRNA (adenine(1518)-N(6)/adenine(1519)-N(6))-dimethyltransferase RsmA [Clostridia bacterium]